MRVFENWLDALVFWAAMAFCAYVGLGLYA